MDEADPVAQHDKFRAEYGATESDGISMSGCKEFLELYPTEEALVLGVEYRECLMSLQFLRERALPISVVVKHIWENVFLQPWHVSRAKDVMFII